MTILVCKQGGTPQDGNSLYGAEDTHTSTGHVDTYINEGDTAADNSSSTFISVLDFSGGDEQRPWLKFDLSALPGGATIVSAHLQMYAELGQTTATIGCYGIKQNATATMDWATYDNSNNWATAGAKNTTSDIDSAAQDTDVYDGTNSTWYVWDVSSWVAEVAAGTRTNYGLMLARTTLPGDSHFVNFSSSNSSTANQTPELWIEYTAGGGGSILPLLNAYCS